MLTDAPPTPSDAPQPEASGAAADSGAGAPESPTGIPLALWSGLNATAITTQTIASLATVVRKVNFRAKLMIPQGSPGHVPKMSRNLIEARMTVILDAWGPDIAAELG